MATSIPIVDLPGTYSLSANSEEELIARDYILQEHPDLVVAVVNAATLERNLYLVAELLHLPTPLLLALNMMDVAEKEGIKVEPDVLEKAIGIPVVPMSASRGRGIEELEGAIEAMLRQKAEYRPNLPSILPAHEPILAAVQELIAAYVPEIYPVDWVALKLLEGDEALSALMKAQDAPGGMEGGRRHPLQARGRRPRHRGGPLPLDRPNGARRGRRASRLPHGAHHPRSTATSRIR